MFWLLIFLIALLALAYRRAGIRSSGLVLAGVILAYGILGHSLALFVLLALIWIAVYVPLSVPALRQEWFSRPALNAFRRGLQKLPASTAALLETGAAGFEAQLFGGAPDWAKLRALPTPALSATQQQLLNKKIDPACSALARDSSDSAARKRLLEVLLEPGEPGAAQHDEAGHADAQGESAETDPAGVAAADALQRGAEASTSLRSIVCTRVAAALGGSAWTLAAPARAGWIRLLRDEVDDGAARDWLTRAATEFDALATAGCGLDPGREPCALASVARAPHASGDAAQEPGIRLSLHPGVRADYSADHYALLVEFPRGAGGKSPHGSACVVLSAGAPGLQVVPAKDGSVRLTGDAVFAPLSALVGGARRIGSGVQRLSRAMIEAEAVNAPALRLGRMLPLALASGAHARLHAPFLAPDTEHGAVRNLLADNAADLYAADALREMTLADLGGHKTAATLAAIANLQTATLAKRVAGRLSCREATLQQLAACPLQPPVSVLSSVQLGLRALGRCHPHLRLELDAARSPLGAEALEQFDEAFWAHLGHVQSNAVRSLITACGAGALLPRTGMVPSVARCQRRIDRASANLALLVDLVLFSLRGRALRNDRLLASIGDALATLQRASAVLWKAQRADADANSLPLLRLATAEALQTVQYRFDDIIRELPRALLRGVARLLVFPFGRWQLSWREGDHAAAAHWLSEGDATRQFAPLLPTALPEPVLRLRRALEATLAGEPLTSRLEGDDKPAGSAIDRIAAAEQVGHLDAGQAAQLREWLRLCDLAGDAAAVDA